MTLLEMTVLSRPVLSELKAEALSEVQHPSSPVELALLYCLLLAPPPMAPAPGSKL